MTDPLRSALGCEYCKTATIHATQWFKMGDHPAVVLKSARNRYADEGIPWVDTLEGGHVVTPGDWIATGIQGEHWPIKPDVFEATYTKALSHPAPTGNVAELIAEARDWLSRPPICRDDICALVKSLTDAVANLEARCAEAVGVEGADWVLVPKRADAAICRAIAKRMTDRPGAIPFDRLGSGPQTGLIGSAAFAWEDALSAAPPDPRKPGPAAGEIEKLEDGWLPNVLCPTDGEWRLHKLPDGAEVVAAFDGHAIGDRRWLIKSFGYHNPSRPNGQVVGGVERMTTAYDTFVVTSMPEGVFPTQFRPNDTVFGKPTPCRAAELAQGGGE